LGAMTRAVRNMSRRKMRALLVIIALGFSMAIMVSIPAGIVANQEAAQSLTANFNSTMTTMQEEINKTTTLIECQTSGQGMFSGGPSGSPFGGSQQQQTYVEESIANGIRSISGVKNVVEFLTASSNETTSETINGPEGRTFTISRPIYTITGVTLNSSFIDDYSILPTNITAGRNLREGDSGVVLLNSNLTAYFGVGVGDKVEMYGESFTVVGVYDAAGQGRMEARSAYMNITDAQMAAGLTGNVSRLDVYAESVSDVDSIAEVIGAAYTSLQVTTYKDRLSQLDNMQTMYNQTLTSAQATVSQTETVATQEIMIAVVATSLIVLFVMLYTVRERTKEIGTLKAIGFSNWNVMSQFMLEGMLLSLVAGVVGIAIGTVGAPLLSGILLPQISPFGSRSTSQFRPGEANAGNFGSFGILGASTVTVTPSFQTMLIAVGAAVLLGALGSLYPAWRAARTRPAEAMRYE
jgi:ABC-type antimicrobial peptide transport system permease subunit